MLASVLVRNNFCSNRMQPLVSVGVIKVPMSINAGV
jgi:hypothetical protein